MKWHDIKKNNLKKEMGYVILMAIVILIGVVFEVDFDLKERING